MHLAQPYLACVDDWLPDTAWPDRKLQADGLVGGAESNVEASSTIHLTHGCAHAPSHQPRRLRPVWLANFCAMPADVVRIAKGSPLQLGT